MKEDITFRVATIEDTSKILFFIKELAKENGRKISGIEAKARSAIYNYSWPGNIREMRNCIESAVVMSDDDILHFEDLPEKIKNEGVSAFIKVPVGSSMEDAEKQVILETLQSTGGNKQKTASILKLGRRTLYRKLESYGLKDGWWSVEAIFYKISSHFFLSFVARFFSVDRC